MGHDAERPAAVTRPRVIWIQRLGCAELALCIVRRLFRDVSVRYGDNGASRSSELLLRLLKRAGFCKDFESFPGMPSDRKDSRGATLFYKIYEDMERCISQFNKACMDDEPEWFKNMTASYVLNWTSSPFHFIVVARQEMVRLGGAEHVIRISGYPAHTIIKRFYKSDGFRIETSISLADRLKPVILPFYVLSRVLVRQILSSPRKSNITQARPSVWVEYEGLRTMLSFWRDYVDKNAFDFVYYIDRRDTPVTEETLEKCAADGFSWVDGRHLSLARVDASCVKAVASALFGYKTRTPIWLHFFRVLYVVYYRLYLSIFRRFRVKVFIQHQNTSWIQQAQAMAVESAGGIMVGFHWSFVHVSLPFFLTPEHVYFVWGNYTAEYLERKGNTCRYILPCGLWLVRDEAESIKNGLSEEVNFVIAIMDSSVGREIYQTPDTLSVFYEMTLRLLEQHPTWGGIVKSKNWELADLTSLPRGAEIVSRMVALMDRKRLVVLKHSASPVAASERADLTVAYGLQTAGVVAGTLGCPVVNWDVAGWMDCRFYADADQTFLYPDINRLEEAIVRRSKGDRSIGDFSAWRTQSNHFSDEDAPRRVGGFIQDFMKNITATGDVDGALTAAVGEYCKVNALEDALYLEGRCT
jgi:hypothetical protein